MYRATVDDPLQHAVLADQVADHDKASSFSSEASEEGFLDPFGHFPYTGLAAAHLVIIKVIHNDIIRTHLAEPESAR